MRLREIYAVRGLEGVLDALEVYLSVVDDLAKAANQPEEPAVEEAEEGDTENG